MVKDDEDRGRFLAALGQACRTTMSLKWIAQELRMGSWTYVANLLCQTKSLNSKD